MVKLKRNERIALLTKTLLDHPGSVLTFKELGETLGAAKSTICEDVSIIKNAFNRMYSGRVKTISGASGGVLYLPEMQLACQRDFLNDLAEKIAQPERRMPGDYLYLSDLLFNPEIIEKAAKIFAQLFNRSAIDYVLTVETNGIALAMLTAKYLAVPLVVAHKHIKVTEGSSLSVIYESTTTKQLHNLYVHKDALTARAKVIIIDDIMRGGGTIVGLKQIVEEFNCSLCGVGVVVEVECEDDKEVDQYHSLIKIKQEDSQILKVRINL